MGIAAAVVVAGLGVYLFHSSAPAASPVSALPGGAVAVVHSGPAMLASESLTGGAGGESLALPGTPGTIVTTPDGSKAFLLDSRHGQVIPVDLVNGKVGAPIPAGKLPVDESLSPNGATLFVTDNLSGAIIPIDTASDTARPAQQLAQGIESFTQSPDGSTGVVAAYGGAGQPGVIAFYDSTSQLATSVDVGMNNPMEVFYSRDGGTVWVTEQGVGNAPGVVIPVDVRSHAVGAPIGVGHSPAGSAISPDGTTLVVTNTIDRSVSVVDLVKRVVVATVPVGAGPERPAISADGATAWVACALDRTLVPVDLRSHRAGNAIALANSPSDLTLPMAGKAAWVLFSSSAGNVTFLTAKNTFGGAMPVGNAPNVVIARDSATAWVANALSDTVQHLDMAGQSVGAPIHVGRTPEELALTSAGRTLLVLSFGDGTHPGFLTAVDTASSSARPPLAVGVAPSSLTLAPDGSTAFIANHQTNSITTVDLKTWHVGPPIALPCSPTQLVITLDGAGLYADCSDAAKVVPVTTSGHAVGTPIAVATSSDLVMGNQGKLIFVNADHAVQEIDIATNKVVLSHVESGNIVSIAPSPDDATIVAAENTGGAVLIINASTLVTTTSISVGARPDGLELSADGTRGYVLDSSAQKLYIVDVTAAKVTTTINVAPNAASVVLPSQQ